MAALDLSFGFDESRIVWSSLAVPAAGSGFGGLIAALNPGNHDLLRLARADAFLAGSTNLEFARLLPAAEEVLDAVLSASPSPVAAETKARAQKLVRSWGAIVRGQSLWFAVAAPEGAPFVLYTITEVTDPAAARAVTREGNELSFALVSGLFKTGTAAPAIHVAAEEHRGYPIDHYWFDLPRPAAEAVPGEAAPQPPALFGDGVVHLRLAYLPGRVVGCYYAADAGAIREFVDRILDGGSSGLTANPAFVTATESLPREGVGLGYVSLSGLMAFATRAALPSAAPSPAPAAGAVPGGSGIGFASYRSGGSFRADAVIPVQQLRDLAASLSRAIQARQAPPPALEAPAPEAPTPEAPAPVPDDQGPVR